ncbi:MAG TPA: hypothetical protein VF008_23015 [Niastella sp.]
MPGIDFTKGGSWEELAKRPKPTNENLQQLFSGIDRISIKEGGVSGEKALTNNVVLEITQQDQVNQLAALLEIDESCTGFYCLCLGTYAIELYAKGQLQSTIGYHHAVSIRYEHWNGDAALAQSDNLLAFLAQLGLTQPLEEKIKNDQRYKAQQAKESEWLAIAPKCFASFWEQINGFNLDYFEELQQELNKEIPDNEERIIALLQTYGKTQNFWTAYPHYEDVINKILQTYHTTEIVNAYINSDRNYKTRQGLGRYICGVDFRKKRKKYLKHIPDEVLNDVGECFTTIGEERGMYEINRLRKEKNGKNN